MIGYEEVNRVVQMLLVRAFLVRLLNFHLRMIEHWWILMVTCVL